MIHERERGLHQIFMCITAMGMVAFAAACYGLFLLFRESLNPAPGAYANFILTLWLGLIIEGLSRPNEWRASPERGLARHRRAVTQRQWLWMTAAITLVLVLTRDARISRSYILLVIVAAYPLLRLMNRWGYDWFHRFIVARSPHWRLQTVMVGPEEWLRDLDHHLRGLQSTISNSANYTIKPAAEFGHLKEWLLGRDFDLLILPARLLPDDWVANIIAMGDRKGFRVWIPVEFSRRFGRRFHLQRVGHLDILTPPDLPLGNTFKRMTKRLFDILVSLPVIVFILWPLVVVVWLIQLRNSRGPVFFRQQRSGENGQQFEVIKFRTMHMNNDNESRQACEGDPRIYRGGCLLRKYSLDEFPQFLNVLRGDMSIVGPRPHLEEHERQFEKCYARYGLRRFVKPGVTGLAQVHGYRGEIRKVADARARARYDVIYQQNWSLSLDLKIILRTVWQVIRPHKSAY